MKYPKMDWGTMEAVVNKLGGEGGVAAFLRGDLVVARPNRRWREKDGVIYLTVTSRGMLGAAWIAYLETLRGIQLSNLAKEVLISPDFKATKGVTYKVAILKGDLFEDSNRSSRKIREEADARNLITPNVEVACLIRNSFTDEELKAHGLEWVVTMHEPVEDCLLRASRAEANGNWLITSGGGSELGWRRSSGFAFVSTQVRNISS